MATASHIELSLATAGVYHIPDISQQSCKISSELLQHNHDSNHIYFNRGGFHNHMAHHLLTIFALGATPDELQKAFDNNQSYQRPQFPVETKNVQDMADKDKFKNFLGQEQYFHDYEIFFRKEMEAKGWEQVLREQLFAGDEHANLMLVRMFAGFYHPIIHLGFGIEFKQPAIMVEALAQAAIHDDWPGKFLVGSQEAASRSTKSTSLAQLVLETRRNQKLRESPHWEDSNKVRDGVLVRAPEEMIELASQWKVNPDELERKTAEMINANVFFAGAAQRPDKVVKFDFFYMHCVNCSIFFSAFLDEPWLSAEDKCRLLEWKGRSDLSMYVSRGCPELRIDEIENYKPKKPNDGWGEIIRRVDQFPDDGHAAKLVRALANGERVCKPYESDDKDAFVIRGDMWLKLGHMAIDSVEGPGDNWIRNVGFQKSWEKIPDRERL